MKKIVILPLFTMESGHHRSSDALMDSIKKLDPAVQCEKVDFLSYVNPAFEKSIAQLYLNWITKVPHLYHTFYQNYFHRKSTILHSVYETLFLEKMEQMLENKQPDLIICTHSFPSFLVSKLKEYGACDIPVINLYTDFFINHLWGRKHIDQHFVPSRDAKEQLIHDGVPEENILITGIVTNDIFLKRKKKKWEQTKHHVLIAGGSLGLGNQLLSIIESADSSQMKYRVLCGSNVQLYKRIASMNSNSIKPLSYITSPEQMNQLYNWADALITKPGGVTVSEALKKKLPIFIHSILPGQEEMNMNFLEPRGLAQRLNPARPLEEQLLSVLNNPVALVQINMAMNDYLNELRLKKSGETAGHIYHMVLNQAPDRHIQYIDQLFSQLYHSL